MPPYQVGVSLERTDYATLYYSNPRKAGLPLGSVASSSKICKKATGSMHFKAV